MWGMSSAVHTEVYYILLKVFVPVYAFCDDFRGTTVMHDSPRVLWIVNGLAYGFLAPTRLFFQ